MMISDVTCATNLKSSFIFLIFIILFVLTPELASIIFMLGI